MKMMTPCAANPAWRQGLQLERLVASVAELLSLAAKHSHTTYTTTHE